MCTSEVTRVNAVSAPPSPVISPIVQAKLSTLLRGIAIGLAQAPQMRACGPTPAFATNSLDQKIWKLLQDHATLEVTRFQAFIAPMIDITNSCAAKCNLCFHGWVGLIRCTADTDPANTSYRWHEVQTWDVGGPSTSGTAGVTNYPANFTSIGNGSKTNGPSWTINATQMETLVDSGVNAHKRFSTTNNNVLDGINNTSTGTTFSDTEMQVQFDADQIGGDTATTGSMATLPSSCTNAQQKPASVTCSVACTWNLLKQ